MNTSEELKARAAEIRDAEQAGENTAHRVGSLLCDLVDLLVGEGDIEEAVITATQKLVSRGDVEAAGKVTAGVLNLLAAGRDAIYIQQLGTLLQIRDLNTDKRVLIPTDKNGVVATTAEVQDVATDLTQAEADIETLEGRVDELDGNVTVKVNPAGGTFYRHGEACTDNWCEKFVSGGIAAVRVETTDEARKINLREQPEDGIYIASGQMQGWRIVAPDGYRIKGYRLSAVLRTEGQATITASTGQEIVVTQEHGASLSVTGLNTQETTFMTTDSSTIWADRQIWILMFEIYVERTSPYATTLDTDALRDALNARVMDLGDFGGVNALNAALADNAPGRACVMLGHVLNAQGYRAYATVCFSVPFATGQYGGFFQGCLTSAGNMQGFATRTVTKNASGARTSTAWTLLTNA